MPDEDDFYSNQEIDNSNTGFCDLSMESTEKITNIFKEKSKGQPLLDKPSDPIIFLANGIKGTFKYHPRSEEQKDEYLADKQRQLERLRNEIEVAHGGGTKTFRLDLKVKERSHYDVVCFHCRRDHIEVEGIGSGRDGLRFITMCCGQELFPDAWTIINMLIVEE